MKPLLRHWLFALNVLAALLAGLAFVAPLLRSLGYSTLAQALYLFYSMLCHQLPERSYFLFGYQAAQCQRNTAIFGALFLAGLGYALVRGRLKPLDWRIFGLLTLPMAVDGATQLVGWRESTWQLRTITGALFGVASVWLVYPWLERELRKALSAHVYHVVLYTKDGCTLCVKAKRVLERLKADYPLAIEEVDITSDAALLREYQYTIPVVSIDGRIAAVSKVSEVWLRRKLDDCVGGPQTI